MGIGEHAELLCGVRVLGIEVGMGRARKLAIGALDLLLGRGDGHADNRVVIALSPVCGP